MLYAEITAAEVPGGPQYGFLTAAGGCNSRRAVTLLRFDGSLETGSRYGCTEPPAETPRTPRMCNVDYSVHDKSGLPQVLSSVDIALHADSVTEFNIYVDDDESVFGQWQATAGTTEMQEISTLRGVETTWFRIEGVMDAGDYLGVLEGVTSVDRARVILYEGEERTAAKRGLNMLLAACSGDTARGDGGERPKLHPIAAEVMKSMGAAGGGGDEEELAMDPVLETTVEIYVEVDDVEPTGISASSRAAITATATTDAASAMNTLDGDATDASSWTCTSGEVCEITYDLQAVESLDQVRIVQPLHGEESVVPVSPNFSSLGGPSPSRTLQHPAGLGHLFNCDARPSLLLLVQGFSEDTDAEGTLNVMAAGESGEFLAVREGINAGGRPVGSDGLQTFGGVRALARYVKIEAVPIPGGVIGVNEASVCAALRIHDQIDRHCMQDEDLDSRWSCGLLSLWSGSRSAYSCDLDFSLNYYRYVRQIQLVFHFGDEQHHEFSIEAETVRGWVTVVPSAITHGSTTDYQTFNVGVHTNLIRLVPKFQKYDQWIGIKEMIILEKRKNDFVAGTIPVFTTFDRFANDDDDDSKEIETPTRFEFDIPAEGDYIKLTISSSNVTAVRMKFPADREFVFDIEYDGEDDDIIEEFTSAGGKRMWETFTFATPSIGNNEFTITAVSGPSFLNVPDYPTLRVVDFQVVGEPIARDPGYFEMVSTAIGEWQIVPDIIADGVSDQEEIMTAICETKGAAFDGTDCNGELDDSTVTVHMVGGDFFVDGPVYIKSGVTLSGSSSESCEVCTHMLAYEGSNNGNTEEDGIVVIDGVIDAQIKIIETGWKTDPTGGIVSGTFGNLGLDVRDSEELGFRYLKLDGTRAGGARFVDSRNISAIWFLEGSFETGNYMDLTRVDDFSFTLIPSVRGLRLEDCHNIYLMGIDDFGISDPRLYPSSSGDQPESVVITGDSSGIVFQDLNVMAGTEPRILMESTEPLTLDNIFEYEDAVSGDCIVQVPEGTTGDLIVQLNAEHTLSKSGNCWVLD
eukprot:jgi/Undpi1/4559/HiC_scaffold_18.g07913.m1